MEWLLFAVVFGWVAQACISDTLKKPDPKPPEEELGAALNKYLGSMSNEIKEIKESLKQK